ncbi:MAG: transcriptional regulator [Bacteroidetes bacterium]|nr:transcriptional regulator [Bacteroidota bacterium]
MIIDDKEYRFHIRGNEFHCALDVTANFIGGKWKAVVMWYLLGGKKRFVELKRRIPAITDKMLSMQLRALEEDGFVKREVYAEIPPRVEYSLTEEGYTLEPVLWAMAAWGRGKAERHGTRVLVK